MRENNRSLLSLGVWHNATVHMSIRIHGGVKDGGSFSAWTIAEKRQMPANR
jgi:hypothetical protein